jgi:hypothetical protein
MPNRDRGPQEVTPVRLEAARAAAAASRGAAGPRPPVAMHAAPVTRPAPLSSEEIADDVAKVRRRAFATAAYAVGAVAAASTIGFADMRMWPTFLLPAATITAFCGVASLFGTVWTWSGARRIGEVGISVFDALDGAWRDVAARRGGDAGRLRAPDAARAVGAGASSRAAHRPQEVPRVPATAEVLASRWGAGVTRAVEDRAAIAHLVGQLGPADREMIPDVLPTADVLVSRVGELATTLHELDRDAPPSLVAEAERRLAEARRLAGDRPDSDHARRVELLARQVETLSDLGQRREHLVARLEGASLLLQNMRLDLLRLRSAGIDSALGELTSATREASALSRDIGRALDVAAEIRKE